MSFSESARVLLGRRDNVCASSCSSRKGRCCRAADRDWLATRRDDAVLPVRASIATHSGNGIAKLNGNAGERIVKTGVLSVRISIDRVPLVGKFGNQRVPIVVPTSLHAQCSMTPGASKPAAWARSNSVSRKGRRAAPRGAFRIFHDLSHTLQSARSEGSAICRHRNTHLPSQ